MRYDDNMVRIAEIKLDEITNADGTQALALLHKSFADQHNFISKEVDASGNFIKRDVQMEVSNGWVTFYRHKRPEEIDAEKAEAEKQRQANEEYKRKADERELNIATALNMTVTEYRAFRKEHGAW